VLQPADRVAHGPTGGCGRCALELDQQHALGAGMDGAARRGDELEQCPVQQLHGGGIERGQIGHRLTEVVQASQAQCHARRLGRDGIESPFDGRHDPERPFRPDEEVQLVARGGERVEGVGRGVLSRVGETLPDEVSGARGQVPGPRAPATTDIADLSSVADELDSLDPGAHAPVAHRARPCGIGRDHAPAGGEGAGGGIRWEAQPVRASGVVHLGPGDAGAGADQAPGGIDRDLAESLRAVHDGAAADVAAGHAAAGAPGDER
jgi:hypothetical protein